MVQFLRVLVLLPFLCVGTMSHANNPGVVAGEAGYLTWTPWLMFWGKGGYADVIVGPTNYGWKPFHYSIQRIKLQAATYDETFQIVDANQIKIHFEVHFLLRPDPRKEMIKDLVEHFAGANWYSAVVQQPLRTFVRDAVGAQDSQTLSTSQDKIQRFVEDSARAWLAEKKVPVILEQVSVGNFQYPEQISQAAAEKQANLQRLQAKATLLEMAKKDAEIKAAEAEGIKRSQDIINQTLTPLYVQHEMIKSIEAIAGKSGNAVIYVPINPNTGLPVVGSMTIDPAQRQGR